MRCGHQRIEGFWSLLLIGVAAACGTSGDGGTNPGGERIEIAVSKTSLTIQQGEATI